MGYSPASYTTTPHTEIASKNSCSVLIWLLIFVIVFSCAVFPFSPFAGFSGNPASCASYLSMFFFPWLYVSFHVWYQCHPPAMSSTPFAFSAALSSSVGTSAPRSVSRIIHHSNKSPFSAIIRSQFAGLNTRTPSLCIVPSNCLMCQSTTGQSFHLPKSKSAGGRQKLILFSKMMVRCTSWL